MPLRHSCEHILHTAMQILYPSLKKVMGPPIENGYYLDFDLEERITEDDFPKIEVLMQKIIDADLKFKIKEVSKEKAQEVFKNNQYKLNTINEIEERNENITLYSMGEERNEYYDLDLCRGPHVKTTSEIKAFKLLSVAGAYYKGSEKNKMLQRIYGTAFDSKEKLERYLKMIEEAKKRDHRKLGRDLEIMMFHETAPGMPYWLPNGVIMYNELIGFWRQEHKKYNYQEIVSPLINKKELYQISGHWEHYLDNMFVSETEDGEIYALKPMNCPNAMVIFGSKTRSYKDLPLRLSDTDTLHRNERSGTLNGLLRAREFRQDDAHIFVTEDQIKDEFAQVLKITEKFYSIFGLEYKLRLGTRPEKYMGDIETWNKAEKELKEILEDSKKEYFVLEGDGAFYGPKIDILMKDSLGRDWQMGTIQLDFQIPRNFNLKYISENGESKTPITIHRVIYGSLERFFGIIIEHFNGAFPVWLSPLQIKVIPITENQAEYANKVTNNLMAAGLRAETNERNESMQAKIRDAQIFKIPYMLIIGKREQEASKVSVRLRSGEDLGTLDTKKVTDRIKEIYLTRSLNLW